MRTGTRELIAAGYLVACVAGVSGREADLRLTTAVKDNDVTAVAALLAGGVDVNDQEGDGATALHWAVHRNNLALTDRLIRAGAQVNVVNDFGETPLSLACTNANLAIVTRLLEAGANANSARPTGETALMTAAWTGSAEVVALLLGRGADPNASERISGQTPLMWAASERHAAVVQALLGHGANVSARSAGGFTPLLFAARSGDIESARLLLRGGADVNEAVSLPAKSGETAEGQVAGRESTTLRPVQERNAGASSLLIATVRGHVDFALFLLEQGADPNADGAGYTPLHWAVGSWETSFTGAKGIAIDRHDEWRALGGLPAGKTELVKSLLDHGANPNARMQAKPADRGGSRGDVEGVSLVGATPLVLAAGAGDVRSMQMLAAAGADPSLTTTKGMTPLMAAAGLSRIPGESLVSDALGLDAAKLALELGNDVNAQDASGDTALHGAAQIRADQTAQFLVERGARISAKNKNGETPLTYAERILVLQGATLNGQRSSTGDLLRKLGAQ